MKLNIQTIKKPSFNFFFVKVLAVAFLVGGIFSACEEDLPGEGSIPDLTPPEAGFSYSASEGDYKQISFTNLSYSATDYVWDFGDGATSAGKDVTHTYAADGSYTVSLTASDKLNQTNTTTQTIDIVEPVSNFEPEILNPGFDIEGDDSFRDHWKNEDLGGVIQITTSPVHTPEKAAKLPSDGSRIGYQLITVEKNKDYIVSFYYTMKESPVGSMTVAILAGHVTNPDDVAGKTINSVTLNDQTDASTYVLASVSFNSGDNTEVSIFFTNVDVESRIDTFTIVED